MTSHNLLMRRLYNRADGRGHYFTRISSSSSSDKLSSKDLYPPQPFSEEYHSVAGCCDGLLCLEYRDCNFVLWNPSTADYKWLPPSDFKPRPCTFPIHNNGDCTMSTLSHVRCLGFDGKHNDYKFVSFFLVSYYDEEGDIGIFHDSLVQVGVYSLKNNSWEEIKHSGEYDIISDAIDATYLNGFCYFKGRDFIVSFNFSNHEFSTLPCPDFMVKVKGNFIEEYNIILLEIDRSLGAVIYPRLGVAKLFTFWVMEEGEGGGSIKWSRKIEFDKRLVGAWKPLGFWRNGASFLFQGIDGVLLEYDYIARELNTIEEIYDYPYTMDIFPYVESTVKLNGKNTLEIAEKVESSSVGIITDTLERRRKTKRPRHKKTKSVAWRHTCMHGKVKLNGKITLDAAERVESSSVGITTDSLERKRKTETKIQKDEECSMETCMHG